MLVFEITEDMINNMEDVECFGCTLPLGATPMNHLNPLPYQAYCSYCMEDISRFNSSGVAVLNNWPGWSCKDNNNIFQKILCRIKHKSLTVRFRTHLCFWEMFTDTPISDKIQGEMWLSTLVEEQLWYKNNRNNPNYQEHQEAIAFHWPSSITREHRRRLLQATISEPER